MRTAICVLLAGSLSTGCLTSLTHDRWSGRDRVSAVGFRQGEGRSVRWIVTGGRRQREGRFSYLGLRDDCEPLTFSVYGEHGPKPLTRDAWSWAEIEPGPIGRFRIDRQASRCDVGLVVESVHRDGDPLVVLRLDGRHYTRFEVRPPRRRGMTLVYPFAAIGDTVALLTGATLLMYLMSGPSWHTWTKTHGVEHHRVPEDEVVGQSPDRGVYP
jgi:hypothetical protein